MMDEPQVVELPDAISKARQEWLKELCIKDSPKYDGSLMAYMAALKGKRLPPIQSKEDILAK